LIWYFIWYFIIQDIKVLGYASGLDFAGIGSLRDGLHPVQAALANSHGSQCGFCTPGFVMSMYSLLRGFAAEGRDAPTEEDIEECLAGNLW